jgi:hypothetical protein
LSDQLREVMITQSEDIVICTCISLGA